jgi:hypothetical protein
MLMTSDHRVAGSSPAGCMPQHHSLTKTVLVITFYVLAIFDDSSLRDERATIREFTDIDQSDSGPLRFTTILFPIFATRGLEFASTDCTDW